MGILESRLKYILKEQGRTQTWLTEKVGVNKSTISDVVNGKRIPTLLVALRIAKTLDVKVEDIWFEENL